MKSYHRKKTGQRKKTLTFGDFIVSVYDTYGRRKAGSIIQLALDTHMVVFQQRPPLSVAR